MNIIPNAECLLDTKTLVAFHHPKPDYPIQILLVPKRPIPDLISITQEDSEFLVELFQAVRDLVKRFNLEDKGYRLVTNGGSYQAFPHLHFHLISE